MRTSRTVVALAGLLSITHCLFAQELPQPTIALAPIVRAVRIAGATELSERESRDAMHVRVGEPLPESTDRLARAVEHRYEDEGYSFAVAHVAFDDATGLLTATINEGVIDDVEFKGVTERVARQLASDFALRAGDVFNRTKARQALRALLMPTRGALAPARLFGETHAEHPEDDTTTRRTFDLVDRGGRRVLLVGVRERDGRVKVVPDLGEREDWFTPVDGFVPSLGMGAVVFDHEQFNHTFISGHLSFRMASNDVGYALGFERPLFSSRKLFVGGELHDLTTSDDRWQVSSNEAAIAAVAGRKAFRDYYERRGVQISGAWRVDPHVELLFAWRGEREAPLRVQSDFSLFNRDETFRANTAAQNGRLNAILVGASIDGTGFEHESLEATYRRHQLETPFGDRLPLPEKDELAPIWRIDWTSEISAPDAFASDFDFRRHIVSARLRKGLSEFQDVGVRAIGGWSEGALPPQRQFSVGGIGSVHGYAFKESVGDTLALLNLEYAVGWRHGLRAIGFFDVGRTTTPLLADSPWLKGVGFGFGLGDAVRLDFGYKVAAVPSSLQVLLRFGRTF
jgi:hypothetical protein